MLSVRPNCVGMGAVILAKHVAQDRRDAVLGPAAVLDAASQARHAVATSTAVRRVQRAVVAYAVWLDILVVEVLTAAHRVRRATVKLASVFIPRRLCQQLSRRLPRVTSLEMKAEMEDWK